MTASFKQLTNFLRQLGTERVPHTEKSFLAHLIGVYRLMQSLGCSEELARAGLFHSVYGTEGFQGFVLPLDQRQTVRQLIGERAERLAYWNCAMHRPTLDRALLQDEGEPYRIVDRFTHESIELSAAELDDLCRVHLIDYLEQVARSQRWDIRPAAFRRMATRLGGVIEEAYHRVFGQHAAMEPCAHRLILNPPPFRSASTSGRVIQAKSPGIECLRALAATP